MFLRKNCAYDPVYEGQKQKERFLSLSSMEKNDDKKYYQLPTEDEALFGESPEQYLNKVQKMIQEKPLPTIDNTKSKQLKRMFFNQKESEPDLLLNKLERNNSYDKFLNESSSS
jgi:hypothetical protein